MTRECFVISPIGEEDSPIRSHANKVLKHLVIAAMSPLGYEVIRSDHIEQSGLITKQIIEKVLKSDLVVADLTGRNPNVFYELSLRHASRRPFVQLISAGETIPFDVAGNRTIQYDIADLDNLERAKKSLAEQAQKLRSGDDNADNPISVALDLMELRGSKSPQDRSLGEILEVVSALQANFTNLHNELRGELSTRFKLAFESLRHEIVEAQQKRAKTGEGDLIPAAYHDQIERIIGSLAVVTASMTLGLESSVPALEGAKHLERAFTHAEQAKSGAKRLLESCPPF